MTTPTPEIKKRKWWMPLTPYVPQPKDTPWYAVNWGATVALFAVPLLYGIIIFAGAVNQAPDRSDLQTLFGKVVQTHRLSPHLLIQLSDGRLKSMEFPVSPSLKGKGRPYYGWREDIEGQALIGCHVEVLGTPIKWTFDDRFRVFELRCHDKNIDIGRLEIAEKKLKSDQTDLIIIFLFVWFLAPVPLFIFILYRERKFYRE